MGLSLARNTIDNFISKALRLYEQKPVQTRLERLGEYTKRWVRWVLPVSSLWRGIWTPGASDRRFLNIASQPPHRGALLFFVGGRFFVSRTLHHPVGCDGHDVF